LPTAKMVITTATSNQRVSVDHMGVSRLESFGLGS
jgi:hypothetical protein